MGRTTRGQENTSALCAGIGVCFPPMNKFNASTSKCFFFSFFFFCLVCTEREEGRKKKAFSQHLYATTLARIQSPRKKKKATSEPLSPASQSKAQRYLSNQNTSFFSQAIYMQGLRSQLRCDRHWYIFKLSVFGRCNRRWEKKKSSAAACHTDYWRIVCRG